MVDVTSRLRLVVDSTGVDRAGRKLRDLRRRTREADDAAQRLRNAFAGLAGVVGAAFSVRQLTRVADEYRGIQNQLRLVTNSAHELREAQRGVLAVANETGIQLETTARLYGNLERFAGQFLDTQQETLDLTRAINQAAVVSGASVTEASNAIRQLTQGIAGGVLRAEEFNSVVENMPRLAEAIAAGLGVGIGELRKQVNEGLVTSERLIEALQSQFGTLKEEFDSAQKTLGQALTTLGNQITVELGQRLQGVQQVAIDALQGIAGNLENIIPLLEGVAAAVLTIGAAFAAPALVTGISAILSPLGLLAAAIAGVVAFRDDIAEWAFGVREAGAVVRAAIEIIAPLFSGLSESIRSFVAASLPLLADFAREAVGLLKTVSDAAGAFVGVISEAINRVEIEAKTRELESLADRQRELVSELQRLEADPIDDVLGGFGTEFDRRSDMVRAELDSIRDQIAGVSGDLNSMLNPAQASGLSKVFDDIVRRAEEIARSSKEVAEAPGPERARREVEKLAQASREAVGEAEKLAARFAALDIEREALSAETEREAEIIRLTSELLRDHAKHYEQMAGDAQALAKADAERLVDLKRANEALEARRKIQEEIAEQAEIINAAALGERHERIAREVLRLRREIADISIDEARALAAQNVALEEQLDIIREQREILERPFDELADNLEQAIIGGGRAGVDGLKDIFRSFIDSLKDAFLLSLFQPLLHQIRNLTSGISVPIFGPQAGIGGPGAISASLLRTPTGAQSFGIAGAGLNTFGAPGIGALSALSPLALLQAGISGFAGLGGQSLVGLGNIFGAGPTALSALNLAGGLLGAGGFGFLAGSTLGDLLGLSGKGKRAFTGASTGAALGFQLGTIVPGIGNVVGAIGGAIIGGLSGLFGGKQSNKVGQVVFDPNTGAIIGTGQKDSSAASLQNLEIAKQIAGQVSAVTTQIADLIGGEISRLINAEVGRRTGITIGFQGPTGLIEQGQSFANTEAGAIDAINAGIRQALATLRGGNEELLKIAQAFAQTDLSGEQILQSLSQIAELTDLRDKPLSEYAQRLKDLNVTFDEAIAAAGGVREAELALTEAREKAAQALRDEFAESVLEQEIARTDQLLAGLREIVRRNADILADDIALNESGALTAGLRAGNFEDFFAQAFQAGQSMTELAGRMSEFEQVVKELGGEVAALHQGFEQATAGARDLFDEQIQADIGQFLDGPLQQLERLLQAQKERLEQAEALGAHIAEVERLTALELRQFFEGLTEQGLQEVQSFLGLFEEATNSVVRNLDLSRQDLQAQRDAFEGFAQQFASLRTGFAERFVSASPRESIDILRGRASELLEELGQGNQSAAQALPQVLNELIDSARQTFGNTQGFTDVFNFVEDILRQAEEASLAVVSDTERQIAALDESNVLLADIRDILASGEAVNAFFKSFASGGIASSDELLALIQQGAGLNLAANDNAAALNITGLIAQSVQPVIAPLASSIDGFTQRLSDLPDLQRLQIEATDRVSDTIRDVGDRLEASLDRLEILEKKVLAELENAA